LWISYHIERILSEKIMINYKREEELEKYANNDDIISYRNGFIMNKNSKLRSLDC